MLIWLQELPAVLNERLETIGRFRQAKLLGAILMLLANVKGKASCGKHRHIGHDRA